MAPRSAYLHVPFCVHRCGYCDFTLVAGRDELMGDFLKAIKIELSHVEGRPVLDTLFFGGGTPTHLPPDLLRKLFELVQSRFELAPDAEFSVEGNPADLSDKTLDVLVEAGVNRLSLGAQSFDEATLKMLERDHRGNDISDCLARARGRIPNISLDLIFAVPGQSLELWRSTLEEAIRLEPTHLSTYGLTFEKGTAFWTRREHGDLTQADEELERQMYGLAMDQLDEAGLAQYEISSFARSGFRCRHNQVYWNGGEFFGFGPGAASYRNGSRILNHRSVLTWLKRTLAGESAIGETETLSPEDRARELLVLGLRQTDGIEATEFEHRAEIPLQTLAGKSITRLIEQGLLEETADRIRLTREGRFLADWVAGELLV
jgi:oxygen-independent coproporphyrinogen-3 oxidase